MKIDEVIDTLKSLNQAVPKPMQLPSTKDIGSIEQKLGFKFHSDYITYLLKASDVVFGVIEPATIMDTESHTYLYQIAVDAWNYNGVPRNLLPICESNGDYYCMNSSGVVFFWSHNGLTNEQWPNLASWIQSVWIEGH